MEERSEQRERSRSPSRPRRRLGPGVRTPNLVAYHTDIVALELCIYVLENIMCSFDFLMNATVENGSRTYQGNYNHQIQSLRGNAAQTLTLMRREQSQLIAEFDTLLRFLSDE